ncbi:MAG TPA: TetR/AcrR family transcriptional regulator [Gemmatimonadaceae bacterium]|nr:TetR/AcrR family transcriptional regulator [Gemmatimonadaceae bacterium]
MTQPADAGSASDARVRIVDAGVRCVAREGVAGASMAAIAQEAGVSKALLHYHYHDRATLMAEVVERIGQRTLRREAAALAGSAESVGLDALWRWLEEELRLGELAALAELALTRDGRVRAAVRVVASERRRRAARSVDELFSELGLTPRIPPALMADAVVAFVDGLALDAAAGSPQDPRVSYDIFWLALLGLTD